MVTFLFITTILGRWCKILELYRICTYIFKNCIFSRHCVVSIPWRKLIKVFFTKKVGSSYVEFGMHENIFFTGWVLVRRTLRLLNQPLIFFLWVWKTFFMSYFAKQEAKHVVNGRILRFWSLLWQYECSCRFSTRILLLYFKIWNGNLKHASLLLEVMATWNIW